MMWLYFGKHFTDYEIKNEHMELIRCHYEYLVVTMDAMNSNLLDWLYSKNVVDGTDLEVLKAEFISSRRNEKLLAMLGRISFDLFSCFMDVLDTEQNHVFCVLRGEEEGSPNNQLYMYMIQTVNQGMCKYKEGKGEEHMSRQHQHTSDKTTFDKFIRLQLMFDRKVEEVEYAHCKTMTGLELQLDQMNTKLRETKVHLEKKLGENIRLRAKLERCEFSSSGKEMAYRTKIPELRRLKSKEIQTTITSLESAIGKLMGEGVQEIPSYPTG